MSSFQQWRFSTVNTSMLRGVARFAAGLAACTCLIFCRFLVDTSRFVIAALHRLATTWTTDLFGLRKILKMPSQVVGIPAELRTGHLPNRNQNDAAGISYNIIKILYFMRPKMWVCSKWEQFQY
jgi:hypothetical protein